MSIPDSLQHKMELFQKVGRMFRDDQELFTIPSWVAVMMGQNIYPETADPLLSGVSIEEINKSLNSITSAMKNTVNQMPSHAEFIQRYT